MRELATLPGLIENNRNPGGDAMPCQIRIIDRKDAAEAASESEEAVEEE